MTRASWNNVFGQVQWRHRASWKQRAGWNLDFHMARSFFWISIWRVENPSGAVLKSIWRVSFSGDFIFGQNIPMEGVKARSEDYLPHKETAVNSLCDRF